MNRTSLVLMNDDAVLYSLADNALEAGRDFEERNPTIRVTRHVDCDGYIFLKVWSRNANVFLGYVGQD